MIPTPENPYNLLIPGPNDFLAVSQNDFLSNFGQLYNAFVQNHVALDSSTLTPGNHTNIQLLQQDQGPQTNVGEISLYSKEIKQPSQTTTQLSFRYQGGNSPGTEVQLTNYQLYTNPDRRPGQFGFFSFLPGGLIVYFGGINFSLSGGILYLDPLICTNIMAFNFCFSGTTPLYPPDVSFFENIPNIKTAIIARPQSYVAGTYYYIVLGNTT